MLILKRKAGESITIDGNIKVKILNEFGTVRLGIDAPKNIKIIRDELTNENKNNIHGRNTCNHD